MPFLRNKTVKNNSYRYLVENYRHSDGKVKQRTINYLGACPQLPDDAPTAVILFAGGGGIECGMIEAGIRPVMSIEYDPTNIELSRALADNNHLNFKSYGGTVRRQTVQELADSDFSGVPRQPDYLAASPIGSNFSNRSDGKETLKDIDAAISIAKAIIKLNPKFFLLENVPAYRNSESWRIIEAALKQEDYEYIETVLDAADYGVPQSRKRFIVKASASRASTSKFLKFPPMSEPVGWYEAIEDLIPDLPNSFLLAPQRTVISEKLVLQPDIKALIIERIGYRDELPQVRQPFKPCWTIKKSIFIDSNNHTGSKFIDLWLAPKPPTGKPTIKTLNIEAIARLQSFPNWYYLPEETNVAGSILGYSVPPLLVKKLLTS